MNVLYVTEDDTIPTILQSVDETFSITCVGGVDELKEELDTSIDFVLTAYDVAGGTGFDVFDRVNRELPTVPCIIVTNQELSDEENLQPDYVYQYDPVMIATYANRLATLVRSAEDAKATADYPLSADEAQRMETVEQYVELSDAASDRINEITEQVADEFDADAVFFGIVAADKELFFGTHGMGDEPLEREHTICTYTILGEDPMVVEDVQQDHRFADNDALRDRGTGWYAGTPVTVDGCRIGALCLVDSEKQSFTEQDREQLQTFANEIEELLMKEKKRVCTVQP